LPYARDDPVGDAAGELVELIAQCADEVEQVVERYADLQTVGNEREQRGTAHDEVARAVGPEEPDSFRLPHGGVREARDLGLQLAAREPQWGFVERGGPDVETEQIGQVDAVIPRLQQVADAGERVAAPLESRDELEPLPVLLAVQPDAPP